MKRVLRLLIRLYPAWWRNRYGGELEALLEDSGSGSRDVWDVFRGAMAMQMKTGSFGRIVTVCVIAGVVVAGAAAFLWPQQYKSTATLRLEQPDPAVLNRVAEAALTRNALASIIVRYNLYRRERTRMQMEDVIDVMRQETWVTPIAPNLAQVSFFYEDPIQAQRVSQDLVGRIIAANLSTPNAGVIQVVAPADQAKRTITGKARLAFTGLGLPVGLLFGVVLALILRRRAPAS
jgi:uncharacterized protein involved in exopolysaccharide biosynthesis